MGSSVKKMRLRSKTHMINVKRISHGSNKMALGIWISRCHLHDFAYTLTLNENMKIIYTLISTADNT